jgi:hypothetical protein
MLRMVIVDDDTVAIEGLKEIFSESFDGVIIPNHALGPWKGGAVDPTMSNDLGSS